MTFRLSYRSFFLAAACLFAGHAMAANQPLGQSASASASADAAKSAGSASVDPHWAELEHSRWIADGRADAPRKVYVFTDPNCPFCTKLWSDARPWVDSGKVQLRHVIVGVLTATSPGKAAAILGDKDPAAALAAYERAHVAAAAANVASGQPHPMEDAALKPLSRIPPADQASLDGNRRLMTALGIRGTPGVASLGADGKVKARQGLTPQDLAAVFGPL